jgi:drug/metabolite transporter (DMT)-like permease
MVLAGVVDIAVGLLLREHRVARWDPAGLGAVLYLVVFGSWVGYSAYVWLLRHVRTTKVATYAYVNPVVAVILGWLILGEPIDRFMLAGAAVIVPAVALVTTAEHDIEPAD